MTRNVINKHSNTFLENFRRIRRMRFLAKRHGDVTPKRFLYKIYCCEVITFEILHVVNVASYYDPRPAILYVISEVTSKKIFLLMTYTHNKGQTDRIFQLKSIVVTTYLIIEWATNLLIMFPGKGGRLATSPGHPSTSPSSFLELGSTRTAASHAHTIASRASVTSLRTVTDRPAHAHAHTPSSLITRPVHYKTLKIVERSRVIPLLAGHVFKKIHSFV